MAESTKFRMNIRSGEIEITGSEEFVEKQIQNLDALIELMQISEQIDEIPIENHESNGSNPTQNDSMPSTFGEWIQTFKSDVNDLDKALLTARYVQHESSSNDFKTSEVNSSLKEHGIKLSNPSMTLKRLIQKKYLFQTRKVGKLIYMRVSVDGQKYLDSIKANG